MDYIRQGRNAEGGRMVIDMVNRPPHYNKGKVECIDALEAATCDLKGVEAICTANAIKYLWRWRQKNGVEDLKKAKWYINHLIEKEGEENGRHID